MRYIIAIMTTFLLYPQILSAKIKYHIQLVEVKRPGGQIEKYNSSPKMKFSKTPGDLSCYYEDSLIKITWGYENSQIIFALYNHADKPIYIDWDYAIYVDQNRISHQVIHSKTAIIDRFHSQRPSVVAPGTALNDAVIPSDNIYYQEGVSLSSDGWKIKPLLPDNSENDAKRLVNKKISIVMPIKIDDKIYNYTFIFKILGFYAEPSEPDQVETEQGGPSLPISMVLPAAMLWAFILFVYWTRTR